MWVGWQLQSNIKFEYFDLTKIRFFEIPDFQQNFKFPDFSLQEIFFFTTFPVFQSAWPPWFRKRWLLEQIIHHFLFLALAAILCVGAEPF